MSTIDEKILKVLRKENGGLYFSGMELGRHLRISRTAIWKHIQALKEAGYQIESKPSQGYRLKRASRPFNELELSTGLETQVIGKPLIFYPKIGSTNVKAFELAEKGFPEGTTVIADFQEHGRGRMGRSWESPLGVNLYLSLILRPPFSPIKAPQMTFFAATAVVESIRKISSSLCPKIKWPNDILINNKKVGGILTEMSSETDRIKFVILGIGINLNMATEMFPEELRSIATSLRLETGQEVDRVRFFRVFLYEFEKGYDILKKDGFVPILNHWKKYSHIQGRRVIIKQLSGEETEGIVTGIDYDGVLLLKGTDGKEKKVISGDLTIMNNKT